MIENYFLFIRTTECYGEGAFVVQLVIVFFSFWRADKGDSLRGSYLHHLSKLNGGAVVGEVNRRFSTNDNTLTVGCSYVVDPETVVKARLNNHGNLGALLQHQLTPKSSLTISGAFDTKALEKNPKFGLALSLKPWADILIQQQRYAIDFFGRIYAID